MFLGNGANLLCVLLRRIGYHDRLNGKGVKGSGNGQYCDLGTDRLGQSDAVFDRS